MKLSEIFGAKRAIGCPTSAEASEVLMIMKRAGHGWVDSTDLVEQDNMWNVYEDLTAYDIDSEGVGLTNTETCTEEGIEIISAQDFIKSNQ